MVMQVICDFDRSYFNGIIGTKLDWGEFKKKWKEANRRQQLIILQRALL